MVTFKEFLAEDDDKPQQVTHEKANYMMYEFIQYASREAIEGTYVRKYGGPYWNLIPGTWTASMTIEYEDDEVDLEDMYDGDDPVLKARLEKARGKKTTKAQQTAFNILKYFEKHGWQGSRVVGYTGEYQNPSSKSDPKFKSLDGKTVKDMPRNQLSVFFDNSKDQFGLEPPAEDDNDY